MVMNLQQLFLLQLIDYSCQDLERCEVKTFQNNNKKFLDNFSYQRPTIRHKVYRFKLLPMNFKTLKLTLQHAFFSFFFPPQIFAHVSRTEYLVTSVYLDM